MWVWVRLDMHQVDFHRRLGEVRKGLRPAEGLWVCRGAGRAELQSLQKGMAPPRVVWQTVSTALRGGPHIPPLELRGAAQVFLGRGTRKKDKRNKDRASAPTSQLCQGQSSHCLLLPGLMPPPGRTDPAHTQPPSTLLLLHNVNSLCLPRAKENINQSQEIFNKIIPFIKCLW